jgi:protocadherin Fat 1/2/3
MSVTAADSAHVPAAGAADNGITAPSATESPASAGTAFSNSSSSSYISLTGINNNKQNLSFTRSEYNVSISESAQGRTFATVIPAVVTEADDVIHIVSPYEKMGIRVPDRRILVKYKIIGGDEKKTFKSESRRIGDFVFLLIRTRSSEGTLNREYQDFYRLKVRGTITSKSDKRIRTKVYCDVHVRVEDANDLSPLFYPTTYNIQVPADSPIDTRVRQVTAFDSDTGLNGEIYYSMDGDEQDFAVHPTLGWITVVRPLKRQANQKRQLVIYASDRERGATPIRKSLAANTGSVLAMQSRAVVNVHITPAGNGPAAGSDADNDMDDDSPDDDDEEEGEEEDELTSDGRVLHKFKVPENSRFATIVGIINETTSVSGGPNSNLKYKLLNYKSRFAIDSKSGVLTVKGLIDREDKDNYQLYVTVSDADSGSTIRQLTVVVTVTDVNDNAPVFRERTYYARVREDLPVGAVIMRMRAVDDDEGLGGRVVYSIRKHSSPSSPMPTSALADNKQQQHFMEEDAFTIDDVMGNVRIAKELDFESKQVYNLTIVARDQGVPVFESTANLLIEVEDVDENQFAPKFKDFVLTAHVKENSPIGTVVMTVDAIDEDWIEKRGSSERKVWFQLVAGNGIGSFAVDAESGRISTSAVLDREIESRYWLTLVARDKSPIPKSSHVHVFIDIQDENDSAPCSDQPFYAVTVKENATIDSVVLQIHSHDDDLSNEPLNIQYRIVNAEVDAAPFVIDSKSGVLRTRDKLDRELQSQYTLDIEIAEVNPDSGHSLMSRTPVIVSIENINDNPPQLVSQIIRCQAYNSLPKEIPVCHVIAYDLDDVSSSSSSSSLVYDIIEGNDYAFFKIDPTKGSIYFAQEKEIPNKAYDLTVNCASALPTYFSCT